MERMTWDEWQEFLKRSPALAARFARNHPRQVPKPPQQPKAPTPPKYPRSRKKWTQGEDKYLRLYWGSYTLTKIAKELGRPPYGIGGRALKLGLGLATPPEAGATLSQFADRSGFSKRTILSVAKTLKVRLRRRKRTYATRTSAHIRTYCITPEQQELILEFLLSLDGPLVGWRNPDHADRCLGCRRNDVPYFGRDRCRKCYARWSRAQGVLRATKHGELHEEHMDRSGPQEGRR